MSTLNSKFGSKDTFNPINLNIPYIIHEEVYVISYENFSVLLKHVKQEIAAGMA